MAAVLSTKHSHRDYDMTFDGNTSSFLEFPETAKHCVAARALVGLFSSMGVDCHYNNHFSLHNSCDFKGSKKVPVARLWIK